jgi:hypothetical protein
MSARKRYLAAIAAHVINGLPAPLNVDMFHGGSADQLGITLETAADAFAWLALDPSVRPYDYRYAPENGHPNGFRIVGGSMPFMGVQLNIRACEDLPDSAGPDDEATVLAFVAADSATTDLPPGGKEVAGSGGDGDGPGPATAPTFDLGPVPASCVFDAHGADWGTAAGATCLNLDLEHLRQHHGASDAAPLTDEQIDGALVALAEVLDANPDLLDDAPAVEYDPDALDQLGVAATDPAEMPDAGEDLRTPDEWQQEYTDQQIMDPDGWRGVKGRPWTDPISREEYLRRRAMCTITGRIKTELAVPVVDGDDTTGGEP